MNLHDIKRCEANGAKVGVRQSKQTVAPATIRRIIDTGSFTPGTEAERVVTVTFEFSETLWTFPVAAILPLPGMPCTYSIGGDRYARIITWVSPSGHQIRHAAMPDPGFSWEAESIADLIATKSGELATRRPDGGYRNAGKSGFIALGSAVTQMDPHY